MWIYLGVTLLAAMLLYFIVALKRNQGHNFARRLVGLLTIFYGLYLATLTGSYTQFVMPGAGAAVIGAGAGAGLGFATWLVLGTVGVATGGIGVAIGAGAMTLIGAAFGGAGGAASGFGFQTVHYRLIPIWGWLPIIVIGCLFWRGQKIRTKDRKSIIGQ